MSTIPFIEARFFDPNDSSFELELRFRQHLRQLRCRRSPADILVSAGDDDFSNSPKGDLMGVIGIIGVNDPVFIGGDDRNSPKTMKNRLGTPSL